ncbi:MAG: rhomboid family intramembrane serine protease [Lachnospiraceae bacterium]|nr:rhomboid family intramembrane serine protease [Lachnospiraceae bacterium]
MNWLQKLERKFGKYAIHNLILYVIILNVAGFILMQAQPVIYYSYLQLSVPKVLEGQVWRLFTFLLEPPAGDMVSLLFFCLLYYTIGTALENTWGAFRFNLYYFTGILFHILAAFLVYGIWHYDMQLNLLYLNMSLFLAFGAEFPDYQLYLFFVLPMKIKWLAILDGLFLAATIMGGFLTIFFTPQLIGINSSVPKAVAALIATANFLLYFFNSRRFARYSPKQMRRRADYQKKVKMAAPKGKGGTRHKCAICGRTENDGDDLEFRFCSKCDGAYEYCQDHLYTHKHVTKDQA